VATASMGDPQASQKRAPARGSVPQFRQADPVI
jgi:hypothetical protein